MPRSIAVFGAGPGLGRAVARRYAHQGYDVALIARRAGELEQLASELTLGGAAAYPVPADLSETAGIGLLAKRIRTAIGEPDVLYYGPTVGRARPAAALTPQDAAAVMALALYSLIELVREFLPSMLGRGSGAILAATGASAVQGMADLSGPGPALAAQRNYLQSLQGEVADGGVYVGRLYIGAPIANSAWHRRVLDDQAAGRPTRRWSPTAAVDPDQLADLLWTMHNTTKQPEAVYPEHALDRHRP